MGSLRTLGRRTIPVGVTLGVTAAAVLVAAAPASAAAVATLSAYRGPSGGGPTVVITADSATAFDTYTTSTIYAQFQRKSAGGTTCTAKYASGAGVVNATATAITDDTLTVTVPAGVVLNTAELTTDYNVCVYPDATATLDSLANTAITTPYRVVPRLELSAENGPGGGGNTLTLTGPALDVFTGSSVGVEFQFDAEDNYCAGSWQATTAVTTSAGIVKATGAGILSTNKVAVTVPAGITLPSGPASLDFHVCVYASEGVATADTANLLLAGSEPNAYSIANVAAITSVTPASGPAQGGTTITVVGTNLASGLTATLGGTALENIVVAGDNLSFTAKTPAHVAGGPFKLAVTTPGGTKTTDAGVFTYTNGITISPNTAPNTRTTRLWMDVKGVGYNDLTVTGTAGATPNGTGAHVYLVKGAYESKAGTVAGVKGNPQTTECVDVLVIDDKELVCGLYLAGNGPAITRNITGCSVTLNGTAVTGASGSTCNFSPSDVGMAISGTSIQAGAVISAFTSATAVTISRPASAAIAASATLALTSVRTVEATAVTSGAATVTSAQFNAVDVGKRVVHSAFPTGTTVVSVTTTGATLSNNATASPSGAQTLAIQTPVPTGTYTLTVVSNGAFNAATTDTGYLQSIITSGSTFTVADY